MFFLKFWLFSQCSKIVHAEKFFFVPSIALSSHSNWLNRGAPCAGDHIVFEENKLTAAVLDKNIDVSQIELSNTGIFYFDNDVILGQADYQQCQRRKSPEHVFFEPEINFGSFHDPNNWKTKQPSSYLHMNWIPSLHDEVIFSSSNIQFYIETSTKIASMLYANQSQTTKSFLQSISSVEGQYKVSLGQKLANIKTIDELEIILPKNPPIVVEKQQLTHLETVLGLRNANMENETMALICPYLKCEEAEDCVERVKPVGHCCSICGAVVHFTGYDVGFENVKKDIEKFVEKNPEFSKVYGFEFNRLDDDETPSSYQISIFKTNTDTKFEEEPIKDILNYLEYKLHRQLQTTLKITEFKVYSSKTDKSIQFSSIIIGCILFVTIMSFVTVKIIQNDPMLNERFSTTFRQKLPNLSFAVFFHAGRSENEIQMNVPHIRLSDVEEDLASEEESNTTEKPMMNENISIISSNELNGITNPTFETISSDHLNLIEL